MSIDGAQELRSMYAADYPRDNFTVELAQAADTVLEGLDDMGPSATDDERETLLRAAVRYAERIGPDGKRLRWKFLDGTRFNRAERDPARGNSSAVRLLSFVALARAGAVPSDWLVD